MSVINMIGRDDGDIQTEFEEISGLGLRPAIDLLEALSSRLRTETTMEHSLLEAAIVMIEAVDEALCRIANREDKREKANRKAA